MMCAIKRIWRMLFSPRHNPEIAAAVSGIERKKQAATTLKETVQRLAEKM
jgi:hypothetical protein